MKRSNFLREELKKLAARLELLRSEKTEWFPESVEPYRIGSYECDRCSEPVRSWNMWRMHYWSGEHWYLDEAVWRAGGQPMRMELGGFPWRWRGLANDPLKDVSVELLVEVKNRGE